MTNVINFPCKILKTSHLPKKRVFYVGYRYIGPMFCQDVQQLYLKRKGFKNGERYWAIITYGKYDECDKRTYSMELEECSENELLNTLVEYEVSDDVSIEYLREMGWQGYSSNSATIKSIYHKCYDGLRFPSFVKPLESNQFGTKVMAQSRTAERFLSDKRLHAYTYYAGGLDGFVWMNLQTFDGKSIKARPVQLLKNISDKLVFDLYNPSS